MHPQSITPHPVARLIPRHDPITGDFLPGPIASLEERFWAKVLRVDDATSCWLWSASRDRKGYGKIGNGPGGRRTLISSRVAWEIGTGSPPPKGLAVLHTCDVPHCVRNDDIGVYVLDGIELPRCGHLFLGTVAQNNRDMAQKGRAAKTMAKLTPAQVQEIRARYSFIVLLRGRHRSPSLVDVAKEYGVSSAAIGLLLHGHTWK